MNPRCSSPATCPEHFELLAMAEGTLSEEKIERIAEHVATCESCDLRLSALEEQSDDLIRALAMMPVVDEDERTFRLLQETLLANPETFSEAGTSTEVLKSQVPPSLILPMQIGNYELLEQIGAGASGAVFRARHRRLDKTVAVKLLLNANSSSIAEFLHEMRVIGQLDHPNIISATDAGEHEGLYFLVMEYAPGLDVSSLLRKTGPLPIAEACEIARQAALGLSVAHENNLVHRDVKTSNLLFTSNGEVKLLDLGLATISSQKSGSSDGIQSGPRGTADYMAPEQWRDAQGVTASADVYSLGCTLYKLLTGDPPFRPLPRSFTSLEEAHLNGEIPALKPKLGSLPGELDTVLNEMLAKIPVDRPSSAREVANRLSTFARGADLDELARRVLPDAPRKPHAAKTAVPPSSQLLTRRNLMGISVLGGLATVAAIANFPKPQNAGIRTGEWRSLSPVPPKLIPEESDVTVNSLRDRVQIIQEKEGLSVDSEVPFFLHLGSPLNRPYRVRVTLEREDWSSSNGFVFRIRRSEQGKLEAYSIELTHMDGNWLVVWNSYSNGLTEKPYALAESQCPSKNSKRVDLVVDVGANAFPDVRIDGEMRPQSVWALSNAGRSIVATHPKQLATTFAGRVGIHHSGESMKIHNTRLMYLA